MKVFPRVKQGPHLAPPRLLNKQVTIPSTSAMSDDNKPGQQSQRAQRHPDETTPPLPRFSLRTQARQPRDTEDDAHRGDGCPEQTGDANEYAREDPPSRQDGKQPEPNKGDEPALGVSHRFNDSTRRSAPARHQQHRCGRSCHSVSDRCDDRSGCEETHLRGNEDR